MTDTKITLLLCLFCAVLASIGLTGLAHGERVAEMREIVRGL